MQAPAFFLQSTPTPAVDDQMYCTDASESRQNTPPSLKERSLVEYRGAGEYNPGESMNESMQQLPRVVVVVDNSYEDEDVVMAE